MKQMDWMLAMNLIDNQEIPEDFNQWELKIGKPSAHNGLTIAYYAATKKRLPKNFNKWHIPNTTGALRTVAHMAALKNILPPDFNQWDLTDISGWTVAHEFINARPLPKGFNQWELADKKGWTVAHEGAKKGNLPDDFNQWGICDGHNCSVGQILIMNKRIFPESHWKEWGKKGRFSDTLLEDAIKYGTINPSMKEFPPYDMVINSDGETVGDCWDYSRSLCGMFAGEI